MPLAAHGRNNGHCAFEFPLLAFTLRDTDKFEQLEALILHGRQSLAVLCHKTEDV